MKINKMGFRELNRRLAKKPNGRSVHSVHSEQMRNRLQQLRKEGMLTCGVCNSKVCPDFRVCGGCGALL
jgi:hypothetical protein